MPVDDSGGAILEMAVAVSLVIVLLLLACLIPLLIEIPFGKAVKVQPPPSIVAARKPSPPDSSPARRAWELDAAEPMPEEDTELERTAVVDMFDDWQGSTEHRAWVDNAPEQLVAPTIHIKVVESGNAGLPAFCVGRAVGSYKVLKMIGSGSFGHVFLAQDQRNTDQLVALKMVPYEGYDGMLSACNSMDAEAKLLNRLRHPHIVRFEEVQWDMKSSVVWLAMEFMDGGTLKDRLFERRSAGGPPFESDFVRRLLVAVCSALRYIHSEGVLHRDVKPANVLLSNDSQQIKLADFGISKILTQSMRAHTFIGTWYYISPEAIRGEGYGPAADAWALGICLYELAALRHPFGAQNMPALAMRVCNAPVPELPAGCPADIVYAIHGFLQKDPRERLSVSEMFVLDADGSALPTYKCRDTVTDAGTTQAVGSSSSHLQVLHQGVASPVSISRKHQPDVEEVSVSELE